ncbi:hypothetical protein [Enterovibrio calviensis]|uniref:hypothetical protein n=1 Tax=Enterovibrio calviensis TaxID=91359 RepID=UPI000486B3DA|nr:hypothetical protein [Enterovibrio calviensis]
MRTLIAICFLISFHSIADSSVKIFKNKFSKTCKPVEHELWKTRFKSDEICQYSKSPCIPRAEQRSLVVCDSPKVTLCYEDRKWLVAADFVELPLSVKPIGNVVGFKRKNGTEERQFCIAHK